MDATFRRRTAGRGSRIAGRRRGLNMAAAERRRLFQLGASLLLFLLVFVGRGVLPEQMAAWKSILCADTDFRGAASAFGQTISEGGGVLEALEAFWIDMTGTGEEGPNPVQQPALPGLPTPLEGMRQPLLILPPGGALQPQTGTDAPPEPTPAPEEPDSSAEPTQEPLVTAMAQQYNDAGEELPDKVSFQYYNLGLEETAVPVVGTVTSAFGFRDHPVNGVYSFHTAVDIGVRKGTDVLACAAGTVRYIGENSIYGLYVRLDHENNVSTFYAHCSELLVHKGDAVECGQTIAKSGDTGNATGPHLHFSVEKDEIRLDPTYYLE